MKNTVLCGERSRIDQEFSNDIPKTRPTCSQPKNKSTNFISFSVFHSNQIELNEPEKEYNDNADPEKDKEW